MDDEAFAIVAKELIANYRAWQPILASTDNANRASAEARVRSLENVMRKLGIPVPTDRRSPSKSKRSDSPPIPRAIASAHLEDFIQRFDERRSQLKGESPSDVSL